MDTGWSYSTPTTSSSTLKTDPTRWDTSDPRREQQWGMPASERWWFETREFPGQQVQKPFLEASPITLESYLGIH